MKIHHGRKSIVRSESEPEPEPEPDAALTDSEHDAGKQMPERIVAMLVKLARSFEGR